MDRNQVAVHFDTLSAVALRKESVDRNNLRKALHSLPLKSLSARRAWIEIFPVSLFDLPGWSLSARRAWIEIPAGCWRDARRAVALRKESVDRNQRIAKPFREQFKSLSARRAWIEIASNSSMLCSAVSRSPQGERG